MRGAGALPIGLLAPRRFQCIDALSQILKLCLHLLMLKLIESPTQRIILSLYLLSIRENLLNLSASLFSPIFPEIMR